MNRAELNRSMKELETMGFSELRNKFRQLFGFAAGQTNAANIRRRIAYRLQELHLGGLSKDDLKALTKIVEKDPMANLKPKAKSEISKLCGTRYQREWKGKIYKVTVLENGKFEYAGEAFGSLSAIARTITGTRWNGKIFFGVK